MKLTDNEKRDVLKLIEEGMVLPEKYRFLLFDESKQVELNWNGKSDEVTNVALPFQIIEQIDEPRNVDFKMAKGMLDFISGRKMTDWTNKVIWGDNKYILSSLKNGPLREEIEKQGGIKLIYIDPPFDVGADFSMKIDLREDSYEKKPNILEQIAYRDTWGMGTDSYLSMIYERLILIKDLLADNGSLYIHCDFRLSHKLKTILDEIFGNENFTNEIIWNAAIGNTASKKQRFNKSYDSILFYRKNKDSFIWNDSFQAYSEKSLKLYKFEDEKGKYRLGPVDQPNKKGNYYDLGLGEKTPKNGYRMPKTRALEWLEKGELIVEEGKVPSRKIYMSEGVRCKDVWDDIPSIQ